MRKILDDILYSLPVQLVFHHIKKNISLLFVWILFIASVFGGVGRIYGIHFLFLDPEYLNQVNFLSFFMVGLSFGNLAMAFHITTYILDSHQFSFLGILERPFAKFMVNNSVIPLITLLIYIGAVINFQLNNEFSTPLNLLWNLIGLMVGITIMFLFYYFYFKFTNKDIFKYLAGSVDRRLRRSKLSRDRMMKKLKETRESKYPVRYYLDLHLKVRSTKNLMDFYDKEAVLKVFDQNHFNSVIIELTIILLVVALGAFMEVKYFQLPAAASAILLFSILVMLVGAVSYWFKGWGVAFVLVLFFSVNALIKTGVIKGFYPARGLDYTVSPAEYSIQKLHELNSVGQYQQDKGHMLEILENWKEKQSAEKPKMILQCVSGGGQRAALWAVNALQQADSVLHGKLNEKTTLITGASGGLIGSAYFRELVYRRDNGEDVDPGASIHLENIGKDNLNAIIFSLVVNDAFSRFRKYEYEGHRYKRDRGYVFEQNLNQNLGGILNKRLSDYAEPEMKAEMPVIIMSPVIANDGRKLMISSQPLSFLNLNEPDSGGELFKVRGVDFNRLFQEQDSEHLNFITALRMSASFPYITPTISLPSKPSIEIMDAGISDNYGVSDALQFIFVFRKWIEENTSGVVLLIIRDTRKISPIEQQSSQSLSDRITYPIASVYNNLGNIQDIVNDSKIELARAAINQTIDMVELEYNTYSIFNQDEFLFASTEAQMKELERASLSWHLTTREKLNIIHNIQRENNQKALRKLTKIMQSN
ncbi:MAG: patatin-like phospholipase family protein [Bacteroidota bacterium]